MSGERNFLSRWSRLKQQSELRRAQRSQPAAPGPAEPAQTEEQAGPETPAIPELPPEELAALPRLEDLTPQTNLAPFLRAGVPASLRNAALRRMWALDPAIRDRVGDALDYAYDWNLPGGVPGTGPLLASDDVQSMLRTILAGSEPQEDERPPSNTDAAPAACAAGAGPLTSGDPEWAEADKLSHATPAVTADVQLDQRETAAAPARTAPNDQAQVRRHGGATPF
ncbi:MAG: DUF3306 domain-containing protein [Methylobacteriaceae bacterium]|nr:DUF3306 domain-containing protein [Methylobacteriaceae bacterium]